MKKLNIILAIVSLSGKSAETPEQQVDEAIQRLIDLYEAWGKPARFSELRLRLRNGEWPHVPDE